MTSEKLVEDFCRAVLPTAILPLYVDGELIALASNDPDLLYTIARQMRKQAQQTRDLLLPPLSREALADSPFTRFDEWLDEVDRLLRTRGHKKVLLALDEFEALANKEGVDQEGLDQEGVDKEGVDKGGVDKEGFDLANFLRLLRHTIQHRLTFQVLLATSTPLEALGEWADYFNNVQVVKISYLKEQEARELIEEPVPHFALHYEPAATQRVLTLTRGHPALLQGLCHEIVTLKNNEPRSTKPIASATQTLSNLWTKVRHTAEALGKSPLLNRSTALALPDDSGPDPGHIVRVADVEKAVPEALSKGRMIYQSIVGQVAKQEQQAHLLLCFLAQQGEQALVSRDTLTHHFPSELDHKLALLLQHDLIEQAQNGYRFQVELIRRFVAEGNREGLPLQKLGANF